MVDARGSNMATDFAVATATFLKWFTVLSGTYLNPKIQLADLRTEGRGRGVVAVEDIEEDEELFTIPLSLALTAANSTLPKDVIEQLKPSGKWSTLIVAIIHEHLRGKASKWYPYLSILPTESQLDSLMFWSNAELAELQGCAVLDKIGKESAEQSWRASIIPIMLEQTDLFPVTGDNLEARTKQLIRLSHMAGSLIMAYAFDVDRSDIDFTKEDAVSEEEWTEDDDGEEEPLKAMVPFADMLNADADRNNARLVEEETDALTMVAIKPIKAGEEIFNDYGEKPRSDLLRMYGYITDNYKPYDVVEIPHQTLVYMADTTTERWKIFKKARDERDEADRPDGYLLSRPAHRDEAQIQEIVDEALLDAIRSLVPVELAFATHRELLKNEPLSISQITFLQNLIARRRQTYASTIVRDEEILADLNKGNLSIVPSGVSPRRYKAAVEVRKGEKEILDMATTFACTNHLKRVRNLIETAPNKRKYDGSYNPAVKHKDFKKSKTLR